MTTAADAERTHDVSSEAPAPNGPSTPRNRPSAWGSLPVLAPLIMLGLLLVCVAYAGARGGAAWAGAMFWIGQLVIFVPVTYRLLTIRGAGLREEREIVATVLLVAATYFVTRFAYAPLGFEYHDEFQQWRTAENMLATGHVFDPNYSLPIGPYYPGLEALTVAASQLSGLSLFHAGVLVLAAARLVLTSALYLLLRRVGGSARIAGIGSILFTTAYEYKAMFAMFIYSNLALPLLVLVMSSAVGLTLPRRPAQNRDRWVWALLGVLVAATVVTHHVTSYVLVVTLAVGGVVHLLRRHSSAALRLLALAGLGAFLVVAWVVFVAPATVDYLKPAATLLIEGLSEVTAGGGAPTDGGLLRTPLLDQILSYGGVLVVALLMPLGWLRIYRSQRGRPWALVMLIISAGFYAVPLIRMLSAGGTEHATRLATYLFVPVGYVLAVTAVWLIDSSRRRVVAVVAATALATVVMAGGITSGWPQHWSRLPTSQTVVSGNEAGVGPEGLAAASWMQQMLPPGQRFAADDNNLTLMGPIGQESVVPGTGPLYYGTDIDAVRQFITGYAVQYVVVDLRTTRQLPANGEYFPDDPLANRHTRPIPVESLTKFDRVPGARRVFDGGDVVIYDVTGVTDAR